MIKRISSKWERFHARFRYSKYTIEEGLQFAKRVGLEKEYEESLDFGFTPDEALQEWDIYPSSGVEG